MTAAAKWTPGPWDIHRDDGSPIAGIRECEGGRFIALTQFDAEDCRTVEAANARRAECTANARLIAAAPELAEALRGLLDLIAYKDGEGNLIPDHLMPMRAARAALAKAWGRS